MQQQMFSSFNQYGKNAIESTKELVAINNRLMKKVLDNQIALTNTVVGNSIKDVDASATKDPKAFIQYQSSLIEEYSEIFRSQAEVNTKVFQEAGEEIKTWYENSINTANSAVKKATVTPIASKAAAKSAKKTAVKSAKKPATKKAGAKPAKKAVAKKATAKPAKKVATKKSAAA